MVSFLSHPDCQRCKLYIAADNPGLTSRSFVAGGKSKVVFFIGEAPGLREDEEKRIWCGWSGGLLEKFISSCSLQKYADVYLGNACRCRPGQDNTPTIGQIKKCRPWLLDDLEILNAHYDSLIIFCLGATASTCIYDKNLTESFSRGQGEVLSNLPGKPRVFFSYHPALLLPHRRPQLIHAVRDHWNLMLTFIKEGKLKRDSVVIEPIINLRPPHQGN